MSDVAVEDAVAVRALLRVEKLERHFSGLKAVDGISFSVAQHEVVSIIGPNGSGKTTTLYLVTGTIPANGGTITLDGADIGQIVNARRGMTTAGGRKYTSEGTTVRGLAGKRLGEATKQRGSRYRRARMPRLMPEQIYAEADRLGWDREEIVRQLKRFGYIY